MAQREGKKHSGSSKLADVQLESAFARCGNLPAWPSVAAALLERLTRCEGDELDSKTFSDVVAIISADAALAAGAMKAANAITPASIATIPRAAGLLGRDGLLRLAISLPILEKPDDPGGGLDFQAMRKHSLAVAWACRLTAEKISIPPPIDADEAFLCGLLHDVGKAAMAHCIPKSFRRALELAAGGKSDLACCEQQVIGLDHCAVARRLAEHWRLPERLIEAIWLHHQPAGGIPDAVADRRLILLVGLADAIVRRRQIGFSGNCAEVSDLAPLKDELGLTDEKLDEVAGELESRVQGQLRLFPPDRADSREIYHKALRDASIRVAEANDRLRRTQGRRQQAETALEHLQDFAASLSEQSTDWEVLSKIAAMMAEAGGVKASADRPVVAYVLGQDGQQGKAVRYDGSGQAAWRTLASVHPSKVAAPRIVSPAAAIEQALSDVEGLGDWVTFEDCRHVALVCAGRWIGGVFVPAGEGGPSAVEGLEEALAAAAAMALAIVQGRCRATLLSEQFALASQVLAATQQALIEARTLAAIGEMAAGAAHELNNPLAVISGRAQMMCQRATGDEERKVWQLIVEQAHRISDIVTEMMELASPPRPQPASIEPLRLLKSAAEEFSSSGHPQAAAAKVDIEMGELCPPIWADEAQVRAVLAELIRNAANSSASRIRLSARADDAADAIVIAVEDNGSGMDEATLASAFTPFFSLQRSGRRTGLGLPKAKRYVEHNSGRIHLTSRSGEGTSIFIQLPRAGSQTEERTK